jgi:hypothetical protein
MAQVWSALSWEVQGFAALALRSHVTVHRYVLLEGEDLVGSLAGFFVRRDVACFLVIGVAILGAMAGSVSPDIYDRDHGRPSYEQYRLLGGLAGVVGTGLMLWVLYARWKTLDRS